MVTFGAERRLDLGFVHQSRSRACEYARPECAELQNLEPMDGATKQVCLVLHEKIVLCCAAIRGKPRQGGVEIPFHRREDVADLQSDRLQRCAGDVGARGRKGHAGQRRASAVLPIGRAKACEGGNEAYTIIALRLLCQLRQRPNVGQAHQFGRPRSRLSGYRDVTLKRVGDFVGTPPGDGRGEAGPGSDRRLGQRHKRRAGSISRFDRSRRPYSVAEQRRVRVPHHRMNRNSLDQSMNSLRRAEPGI